jgi:hypothetical protein
MTCPSRPRRRRTRRFRRPASGRPPPARHLQAPAPRSGPNPPPRPAPPPPARKGAGCRRSRRPCRPRRRKGSRPRDIRIEVDLVGEGVERPVRHRWSAAARPDAWRPARVPPAQGPRWRRKGRPRSRRRSRYRSRRCSGRRRNQLRRVVVGKGRMRGQRPEGPRPMQAAVLHFRISRSLTNSGSACGDSRIRSVDLAQRFQALRYAAANPPPGLVPPALLDLPRLPRPAISSVRDGAP